ncbi:acyl-CoA thioesterase [Woodsholea maritima]|uniref:acyl-CoA thioesterase n=1 Tax=Woodsholea maritima TaxID=240237 RepID=UPI00037465CD|nr:acyl-CoA thioesterase [Woodsholea maritima]
MAFDPHSDALTLCDLVFPGQTNHQGSLFGGTALAHMDKVAFLVAARHARRPFVTAASDKIEFKAPAFIGNMLELAGEIRMVGRHSMSVRVTLMAENLLTGDRHVCTAGDFVMVAADRKTNESPVPPVPAERAKPLTGINGATRMVEIVFPTDTDHLSRLYGGSAMERMGKAAVLAAYRHSRQAVVMAASDKINFTAPAREGEMIDIYAEVVGVGRTSMRVAVRLDAEDLMSGERRTCSSAEFILVCVDEAGKPSPAPALSQAV